MKTRHFLLLAGLVLAMAFTFSCSSDDGGGGGGGGSVTYEGQKYKTVVIGEQVWFAENLNYAVAGSKCYGEGGILISYEESCDEEDCEIIEITETLSNAEVQANCDKYGRLYDWATAMALPSICNDNSCSNQVQPKHRGICPSGWHIPSDAEWTTLTDYVGSSTAGTELKAKSGWNSCGPSGSGSSYSCEDTYEFSALPGGVGLYSGICRSVGDDGRWWSATEGASYEAYYRGMYYSFSNVPRGNFDKPVLYSVRCVQD